MSEQVWRDEPNIPNPGGDIEQSLEEFEGKLYMCGSYNPTNRLYCYDPVAEKWSKLAEFPTSPTQGTNVLLDGKFHRFSLNGNSHHIYDISTGVFTNVGPTPSFGQSPVRGKDGKIYAIDQMSPSTKKLYIYDVATDKWSEGANCLIERSGVSSILVGDKLYLFGGTNAATNANTAEVYDIPTNTWSLIAPMPEIANMVMLAAYKGEIYLCGGQCSGHGRCKNTYIYNIASNTYREGPPIPIGTSGGGACVYNGRLYLAGGSWTEIGANCTFISLGLDEPTDPAEPVPPKLGVTLQVAGKAQMSISRTLADNTAYTWATREASIASVNANGQVTGVAPGETLLTVSKTGESYTESLPLRVEEAGENPDPPDPPDPTDPPKPATGKDFFFFARMEENGEFQLRARQITECKE